MRGAVFFLIAALPGLIAGAAREPDAVVVRRVSGDVRMLDAGRPGNAVEVKAGDLPDSGRTFVTGADGSLTLRFHPDFMSVEAPAHSRFGLEYAPADSGGARRITLSAGKVLAALSREGPALRFEDAHSLARVSAGRISFATAPGGSTILVLDGEAEVFNRATGTTEKVSRGGKAVAGPGGTTVTRADARELAAAGLRQNRLEVDFWNPATEDFRTLEVEYESRP